MTERLESFRRWLVERGLRVTSQRDLIASALFDAEAHTTVDELARICQEESPELGIVTVHRTIALLCEGGFAQRLALPDRTPMYEATVDHHDHLVCVDCGRILEVEDEALEARQGKVVSQLGFRLLRHRHLIYGACLDTRCPHREGAGTPEREEAMR